MMEHVVSKTLHVSFLCLLSFSTVVKAAQVIDLHGHAIAEIRPLLNQTILARGLSACRYGGGICMVETSRAQDFNHTTHIRLQETYLSYPVLSGEAIMHFPGSPAQSLQAGTGSLDGKLYKDLQTDLVNSPPYIFQTGQSEHALQHALHAYRQKYGITNILLPKSKLLVYIDQKYQAHWAFQVSFYVPRQHNKPSLQPYYILDAMSFKIYKTWNTIETFKVSIHGGGFGGNAKTGKIVYDGLKKDFTMLTMQRDTSKKICYLRNKGITVKSLLTNKTASFSCKEKDSAHNNVYWDGALEEQNGGYSPDNDALFGASMVKDMYQSWYKIPVLQHDGHSMLLKMLVHFPEGIAYWDGEKHEVVLGDGGDMGYPYTTIDVIGHEISHGFTDQHSKLVYHEQSGAMSEAFSDMAAVAVRFYTTGKAIWTIEDGILKQAGKALRYVDQPTKDCYGKKPGDQCSIDHVNQYNPDLDAHYGSGVYNRAFFLLATTPKWSVKKAFDVMVQANLAYWTANSTFASGACGVVSAAKDYKYDVKAVQAAFHQVGIDTASC